MSNLPIPSPLYYGNQAHAIFATQWITVAHPQQVTLSMIRPGASGNAHSQAKVTDGKWHHVIAECNRGAQKLTIYIDGAKDSEAPGLESTNSLRNNGNLYVGGTPRGLYFNGTFDFLRICLGTLWSG